MVVIILLFVYGWYVVGVVGFCLRLFVWFIVLFGAILTILFVGLVRSIVILIVSFIECVWCLPLIVFACCIAFAVLNLLLLCVTFCFDFFLIYW